MIPVSGEGPTGLLPDSCLARASGLGISGQLLLVHMPNTHTHMHTFSLSLSLTFSLSFWGHRHPGVARTELVVAPLVALKKHSELNFLRNDFHTVFSSTENHPRWSRAHSSYHPFSLHRVAARGLCTCVSWRQPLFPSRLTLVEYENY